MSITARTGHPPPAFTGKHPMKAGKMLHGDSDNNGLENALRCDDECSALQQPMQHAASGIAPHCIVKVKSVPLGSEK